MDVCTVLDGYTKGVNRATFWKQKAKESYEFGLLGMGMEFWDAILGGGLH